MHHGRDRSQMICFLHTALERLPVGQQDIYCPCFWKVVETMDKLVTKMLSGTLGCETAEAPVCQKEDRGLEQAIWIAAGDKILGPERLFGLSVTVRLQSQQTGQTNGTEVPFNCVGNYLLIEPVRSTGCNSSQLCVNATFSFARGPKNAFVQVSLIRIPLKFLCQPYPEYFRYLLADTAAIC